jgi:uncharacterized protein YjaG (DUF416 family)
MILELDPAELTRRLGELPERGRLAFGALLLERSLPNFFRFACETGAPGGAMLRAAQAKIWGLLEEAKAKPFRDVTSSACESFAPDTEERNSLYTSSALDAVTIACNVLDYLESGQTTLLVESNALRRDSIDMFLQLSSKVDSDAADFETQLLHHPLMQEEFGFQRADLDAIQQCGRKSDRIWSAALRRAIDFGYSSLRMT